MPKKKVENEFHPAIKALRKKQTEQFNSARAAIDWPIMSILNGESEPQSCNPEVSSFGTFETLLRFEGPLELENEARRIVLDILDRLVKIARAIGSSATKEVIGLANKCRHANFPIYGATPTRLREEFVECWNCVMRECLASGLENVSDPDKIRERLTPKVSLTPDDINKIAKKTAKVARPGKGGARRGFDENIQGECWRYWELGKNNDNVKASMRKSGHKVAYRDVYEYFKRELKALDPPIESLEDFRKVLKARSNRISRGNNKEKKEKKSH